MNTFKKFFFTGLIVILTVLLPACSTATLQTDRLNLAENYIVKAERIIANSSSERDRLAAEENLGTAKAYLETLRDNRKFLSDQEQKKRLELKQRADRLLPLIYK